MSARKESNVKLFKTVFKYHVRDGKNASITFSLFFPVSQTPKTYKEYKERMHVTYIEADMHFFEW